MYKIGIDVGGMSIKAGIVANGEIIKKSIKETNKSGGVDNMIDDITQLVNNLLDESELCIEQISSIGIGFPGVVTSEGRVSCVNLGLDNALIVPQLEKNFKGTHVSVGNDANVAALGEMMYHNEYKHACMLTLGTGVGCGIVINGKILEGTHGAGGEVGHMALALDYGFDCGCGLKGCLETVASATGVVRLAKYHKHQFAKTILGDKFSARDVFDAAKKSDELALFVVDKVCFYIAKAISVLAVCVDVDVYYIGGGVSKAGDILINGIKKHYKDLSFFAVKDVRIEAAHLLNDAGMLGAACLID